LTIDGSLVIIIMKESVKYIYMNKYKLPKRSSSGDKKGKLADKERGV